MPLCGAMQDIAKYYYLWASAGVDECIYHLPSFHLQAAN